MLQLEKEQIIDHLIAQINTGAAGRLIIFKPQKNPNTDLEVQKRGDYKAKPLRLSVFALEKNGQTFETQIPAERLESDESLYIVCASFDEVPQKIQALWAMPSATFPKQTEPLHFTVALSPDDPLHRFAMSPEDLGKMLLSLF